MVGHEGFCRGRLLYQGVGFLVPLALHFALTEIQLG